MPRKNRREIFEAGVSSCNHCTARCVRQLYLLQSENGLHRRKVMMQRRLMFLKEHFAIEIFAFAILDNHVHLLLRNQPEKVDQMSDREVARHWLCMFPGNTKKKSRAKKAVDKKKMRSWKQIHLRQQTNRLWHQSQLLKRLTH